MARARGDARPDSDVDLLIVEREPFSPQRSRRQETARLYLALRKLAISKDLLLYSCEEFERLKISPHHVVGRALREEAFCMSVPDYTRGLLSMACKGFDALRGMLGSPLFADEIFGFHAQQAVEKSLKAWLASRSVAFPFTHDLSRLLDLLEESGADVGRFWPLVEYTVFAVQARYEAGLLASEVPIDRIAVIDEVRQLLGMVAAATGLSVGKEAGDDGA